MLQCSNARWPCTEPISTNSPWGGHKWGGSVPIAHTGQGRGAVSLHPAAPLPTANVQLCMQAAQTAHTHTRVCTVHWAHSTQAAQAACMCLQTVVCTLTHVPSWHRTRTHTRASSLPAQPDTAILLPAPGAAGEAPALPCPHFVSCIWWSSSSWDSTAAVLGGFSGKSRDLSCHCRA